MQHFSRFFAALFFLALANGASAQLFVDTTAYTAQGMISDFFDSTCVAVSNITYTGDSTSMSFFEGSQTNLGINAGILITTGNVFDAIGPNDSPSTSTNNGNPGDTDLDGLIPGYITYDASVLEFDLVPQTDTLTFVYSFASEEYQEFVNTSFNDVFGFFVSGPGLVGTQNIAQIPGVGTPVAINTVNQFAYSQYFVDNGDGIIVDTSSTIEYDGFTTPLTAQVIVMQDSVYHIKIAVADAGDGIFDSGVFLSIESLCGDSTLGSRPAFSYTVSGNTVQFSNQSMYATRFDWDFGDGTTSTERNPVHTYADHTQTYLARLTTTNFSGSNTVTHEILGLTSLPGVAGQPFTLYPNPTEGQLNISLGTGLSGEATIYDLSGRQLQTLHIHEAASFDLNSLGKGMYLVAVTVNGERHTVRVSNK